MNKTYIDFISEQILIYEIGKPIYVRDLSEGIANEYHISKQKASGAVSVAIKRIMEGRIIPDLRFYQKGIYYRVTMTPFGETVIDREQLIKDKYLINDSGYETGISALHKLGLTSLLPNKRVIASNQAGDCARIDHKLDVVVRPPKTAINSENKIYLKILDMLDEISNTSIDADDPYGIIGNYINQLGLAYDKLLALADNYYNRNTIINLAHVAGGQSK